VEHEHRNGHTPLNGFEFENGHAALSVRDSVNGHAPSNGHVLTGDLVAPKGHAETIAPAPANVAAPRPPATATEPRQLPPLQQLREARRRQGLSVRCVAQRLNMSVGEVRAQEEVESDLLLSELYRWQAVLDVPLEELLADPQDALSPRVLLRARMLRVMKTARALRAQARSESENRLAKLLISQLIEIMPELKEVSAWPTVGHRRTADEMGRIAEHPIPDDFMHEAS
jgi:transcriptional regulator with XRE-family HTH domain